MNWSFDKVMEKLLVRVCGNVGGFLDSLYLMTYPQFIQNMYKRLLVVVGSSFYGLEKNKQVVV